MVSFHGCVCSLGFEEPLRKAVDSVLKVAGVMCEVVEVWPLNPWGFAVVMLLPNWPLGSLLPCHLCHARELGFVPFV